MEHMISVLVPVYNTAKYLEKCLDSILAQTYTNLEIILLDDGSSDGSKAICDAYAEKDSRIRVVQQKNAGIGPTRNRLLSLARAELVMFVDSDDLLPPDAIQTLYARMVLDGSDLAAGKYCDIFPGGIQSSEGCAWFRDQCATPSQIMDYAAKRCLIMGAPWAKLYKKELFDGLSYPPLRCCEDLWIFYDLLLRCRSISLVNEVVYHYYKRTGSITQSKDQARFWDCFLASIQAAQVCVRHGYPATAKVWFASALDWALKVRNKKQLRGHIQAQFPSGQCKAMMEAQPVRVCVKWAALYLPLLDRFFLLVQQFRRKLRQPTR